MDTSDKLRGMGVVDTYVYLLQKKGAQYPYPTMIVCVYSNRREAWLRCDQLNSMNDPNASYSVFPMSVH